MRSIIGDSSDVSGSRDRINPTDACWQNEIEQHNAGTERFVARERALVSGATPLQEPLTFRAYEW